MLISTKSLTIKYRQWFNSPDWSNSPCLLYIRLTDIENAVTESSNNLSFLTNEKKHGLYF